MRAISILLADDHTLVRQGLRSLLAEIPRFTVVGEAADGIEALQAVEKLKPDVVLMDIMMPNLNGLDAAREIVRRRLKTRVIILSMHTDSTYALRAFKNGAMGYLPKDADQEEIERAIHAVVAGQWHISTLISGKVVDTLLQAAAPDAATALYDKLTVRERQVLQMIAEGNTNASMAEKLTLSRRTVEVHRSRLMARLKIKTQAELVRFAIQNGLVKIETNFEEDG